MAPTTSYTSGTFAASAIGSRTDSSGSGVTDVSAEEERLRAVIYQPGYISGTTAFQVAQQTVADMTVKVGSGTAKADIYAIAGTTTGQGTYLVRLDDTSVSVTIGAADASQTRTDEIYLVLRDNSYDAQSRSLPQLGYRKGDLGGANPGADSNWKAYALLARITVPAAATTITTARISDQRVAGGAALPQGVQVNLGSSGDTTTPLAIKTAASSSVQVSHRVTGDTVNRFEQYADGKLKWGSGSGAVDTNLYRSSSAVLRTDGDMQVAGGTSVPRGIIARLTRTSDSSLAAGSNTSPSTGKSVSELSATVVAGRLYRVSVPRLAASAQTATHGSAQLTYTVDGSTPSATSTRLSFIDGDFAASSVINGMGSLAGTITPGSNATLKVLLSIYTSNGANFATYGNATAPLEILIEDLGVDPTATGTNF